MKDSSKMKASEIALIAKGQVVGDASLEVVGPERIEHAFKEHITFLSNPKYEPFLYQNQPGIVIVPKGFIPKKELRSTLIQVEDVAQSVQWLLESLETQEQDLVGVSAQAHIAHDVVVDQGVHIGPLTFIDSGSRIGKNTKIYPQVYIGKEVVIGDYVTIYPGVRIYDHTQIGDKCIIHANAVIGSDGFGYTKDPQGRYVKVSQLGNVVIKDRVEVGANTVIDRAVMGSTIIGSGTKLDNLIQIAHNVEVGENTAIAAQAGIAGSVKVGANCMIGGQAGIRGHISIANETMIQAQSGIMSDIHQPKSKMMGSPALSYYDYLKSYAIFRNLPAIKKKLDQM